MRQLMERVTESSPERPWRVDEWNYCGGCVVVLGGGGCPHNPRCPACQLQIPGLGHGASPSAPSHVLCSLHPGPDQPPLRPGFPIPSLPCCRSLYLKCRPLIFSIHGNPAAPGKPVCIHTMHGEPGPQVPTRKEPQNIMGHGKSKWSHTYSVTPLT